jgi:transcriptional regulator with XRE-family HTH domain
MNSLEASQMSTNLNSKKSLIQRFQKGRHTRNRFVESHLDKKLAFQIRSLRGDASQDEMEKKTGIKQQAISRLENPYYGKATLTTLKKIAAAFDVALLVEFIPFSQFLNRASGTPYVERGYSPETMKVPSFEHEATSGTFEQGAEFRTTMPGRPQTISAPRDEVNGIHLVSGGRAAEITFDYEQPNEQKNGNPNLPFPPQGTDGSDQNLWLTAGVGRK